MGGDNFVDTFGVRKEVILSCLNFRREMLSYLDTKHAKDNEEEFCSKIRSIYGIFGADVDELHANDFVHYVIHYDGSLGSNFMFPIYDGIRTYNGKTNDKKVIKVMSPVWNAVRGSKDLSLLLEHRNENYSFDEILFVLIMIGAWRFGDFVKMCGDFGIIMDRVYNSRYVKDKSLNGYPCLPCFYRDFNNENATIVNYIIQSYIGSFCSETSVEEVLKYEDSAESILSLMKQCEYDTKKLLWNRSTSDIGWRALNCRRLICSSKCDMLMASRMVNVSWFKEFLWKISVFDIVRSKNGIRTMDKYWSDDEKYEIDPDLLMKKGIFDGDLFKDMKVSVERDNAEIRVSIK